MRIFISYSTPDLAIVSQLANQIRPHAEVYYWAESNMPGQDAWQSIFAWIDSSDLVIVLITDNAVRRAFAIGNEVGRAVTKGVTVVPIVSKQVPSGELACLTGTTYQPIETSNPQPAIDQVTKIVQSYKLQKEENQKQWLIIFIIFAALFLLSRE